MALKARSSLELLVDIGELGEVLSKGVTELALILGESSGSLALDRQ